MRIRSVTKIRPAAPVWCAAALSPPSHSAPPHLPLLFVLDTREIALVRWRVEPCPGKRWKSAHSSLSSSRAWTVPSPWTLERMPTAVWTTAESAVWPQKRSPASRCAGRARPDCVDTPSRRHGPPTGRRRRPAPGARPRRSRRRPRSLPGSSPDRRLAPLWYVSSTHTYGCPPPSALRNASTSGSSSPQIRDASEPRRRPNRALSSAHRVAASTPRAHMLPGPPPTAPARRAGGVAATTGNKSLAGPPDLELDRADPRIPRPRPMAIAKGRRVSLRSTMCSATRGDERDSASRIGDDHARGRACLSLPGGRRGHTAVRASFRPTCRGGTHLHPDCGAGSWCSLVPGRWLARLAPTDFLDPALRAIERTHSAASTAKPQTSEE